MDRLFVGLGGALALIAVALGAFGAHGLRRRLSAEHLDTFETAVRYQMYHALGILAAGLAWPRWPGSALTAAGWLFLAGVLLFSGSLYALSLSGMRRLGMITPFGGLAFLLGWAAFVGAVLV